MNTTALRRAVAGLGALTAFGLVVALGGPVSAATTFDGSAAAYGVLTTASNPSFPLGLVPEGSGPTAQARLNSLPQSSSFASFPYPGDSLVGLPGLIGALVPGSPPLPTYPLFASSELGDDPTDLDYPGIELHSESGEALALARAQSGSASSGYTATARVESHADGSVNALADARQSAIGLGAVATFDGIRSMAKVRTEGGKLVRSSSLEIASIRVPAARLSVPKDLPLGGTIITGPDLGFRDGSFVLGLPTGGTQKLPVPSEPVFQALAAAGITGTYQKPQTTPTGVIAAALSFTATLPAPPDNPSGIGGATKVTLDFGRSTASVSAHTFNDSDGSVPTGPLDGSAPSTGTGAAGPAVGGTTTPTGGLTGVAPSNGAPAVPPTVLPAGAVPAADGLASPAGLVRRSSTLNIYLALVGACIAGTVASQTVRLLGVRSTWIS